MRAEDEESAGAVKRWRPLVGLGDHLKTFDPIKVPPIVGYDGAVGPQRSCCNPSIRNTDFSTGFSPRGPQSCEVLDHLHVKRDRYMASDCLPQMANATLPPVVLEGTLQEFSDALERQRSHTSLEVGSVAGSAEVTSKHEGEDVCIHQDGLRRGQGYRLFRPPKMLSRNSSTSNLSSSSQGSGQTNGPTPCCSTSSSRVVELANNPSDGRPSPSAASGSALGAFFSSVVTMLLPDKEYTG